MVTVFSYDDLYQRGIQVVKFGQSFDVDYELEYVNGWDFITIKMDGGLHQVAIESTTDSVIMGAVVHVPNALMDRVDKYCGREYKRISVTTMTGMKCQMYVKR